MKLWKTLDFILWKLWKFWKTLDFRLWKLWKLWKLLNFYFGNFGNFGKNKKLTQKNFGKSFFQKFGNFWDTKGFWEKFLSKFWKLLRHKKFGGKFGKIWELLKRNF